MQRFALAVFVLASGGPQKPRPPGPWDDRRQRGRGRTYRGFFDGPKPVGAGVERVMLHLDAPTTGVVTSIFSDWEAIVGETIAAHARPQRIKNGELVLEVDDPAWASEMEWLGEEIVRKIHLAIDTEEITSIKVLLSRK